jgi:uncharacterized protein (TIGR02300 family)
MIKPEFGHKCVCVSCAARFYDMTRLPAICPKCSTPQPPPKLRVYAPSRAAPRSRYPVAAPKLAPAETDPAETDGEPIEEAEEEEAGDDDAVGEEDAPDDAAEAADRVVEEV